MNQSQAECEGGSSEGVGAEHEIEQGQRVPEGDEEGLELGISPQLLANRMQAAIVDRAFDRNHPAVQIETSSIAGQGLFATHCFKKGEVVLEFFGATVGRNYSPAASKDYLLGLNAKFQVDPLHEDIPRAWKLAWAVNHSCDGNLIALKTSYRRLGFSSEEAAHLCLSPSPPAHPHVSADPGSSASKGTEGRGRVRSDQDVPREEQAAEKKPLVESVGRKETECRKRRRESDVGREGEGGGSDVAFAEERRVNAAAAEQEAAGGGGAEGEEEDAWDELIFMVARRDVESGAELCFDYRRGVRARSPLRAQYFLLLGWFMRCSCSCPVPDDPTRQPVLSTRVQTDVLSTHCHPS